MRSPMAAADRSTANSRSRRPSGEAAGAPGLAGAGDLRPRSSSGSAARPTTRASSPRSIPIPTRDRNALLRKEGELIVALDQVQDPRNLGAVCRSAELAGAAGRRDPGAARGGGDRGRLQGLGGGGRAPRDRPRPQPRRLARRSEAGRLLDLGRRRRAPSRRPGTSTSPARRSSSSAGRGAGSAPASPPPATAWSPCRAAGSIDSLNVSAAAAALLFEAVRQRS